MDGASALATDRIDGKLLAESDTATPLTEAIATRYRFFPGNCHIADS